RRVLFRSRNKVPPAALTLMRIQGIGPKRAMLLAQELKVHSVEDLQVALESGQVAALPRLGEKTASSILDELRRLHTRSKRLPLAIALPAGRTGRPRAHRVWRRRRDRTSRQRSPLSRLRRRY